MLQHLDRITFDPKIMAGKACIRGMRVPVSLVINLVANGKTNTEIIADYPYLEPEDIRQSLLYAKAEIIQDFRQAWQEAMTGKTIPIDQIWEGIEDV
jgi:uncharacterized protein (DUF433 family)